MPIAILALWVAGYGISEAQGDGGVVRWSATAGPWEVTTLTAPNPLLCGEVEVSVLVQDHVSGRLVPDVQVKIALTPAGAVQPRSPRLATAEHGPSKLYQSATFLVATPGEARVEVELVKQEIVQRIGFTAMVGPAPNRMDWFGAWMLWPLAPIFAYVIREIGHLQSLQRTPPRGSTGVADLRFHRRS